MKERLVHLSWDFIKLKCGFPHTNESGKPYNPFMEIKNGMESAYYDCPDPHCTNRIPLLVYEKLLEKCIDLVNSGKMEKGYAWKEKIARQMYELEILNYKADEKVVIGIRNLSVRKRG